MNKNFLSGLLTGTAIGFLVGLLSANEEGIIYRNNVINLIEDEACKISNSIKKLAEIFRKKDSGKLIIEEELH